MGDDLRRGHGEAGLDKDYEAEAKAARDLLGEGKLAEAAQRMAAVLTADPTREDWIVLIDDILSQAADPLALLDFSTPRVEVGQVAVQARALVHEGELTEALALLSQVSAARPEVPFLTWAESWLDEYPEALTDLEPDLMGDQVVGPCLRALGEMPAPLDEADPRRLLVAAFEALCRRCRDHWPEQPLLWSAGASAARRLGRLSEAVTLARQGVKLGEDWHTCVGLACALRDAGRVDEAVTFYRQALTYEPEDITARLDIADTLLDCGRLEGAIEAYEEVLSRHPAHPWARPSVHYTRFRHGGSPTERAALLSIADRDPMNLRAQQLADELDPPTPYVNRLPGPADATVHALQQVVEQIRFEPARYRKSSLELRVSALESPSALVAWRMQLMKLKAHVSLDLKVQSVPTPDPRVPRTDVDFRIWMYDGVTPRPAFPPPSGATAEALVHSIGEIARRPYRLESWSTLGKKLASGPLVESAGPEAMEILLGAMLYPPAPPPEREVVEWVQRVQIAAAMTLAWLGDEKDGGKAALGALRSLALGPVDWVNGAALVAYTARVKANPTLRPQLEAIFTELARTLSDQGYTAYELPLASCWLSLGAHSHARQVQLSTWVKSLLG
ncbi:MAG: tetratricopeptide repeat protein [Bradymonadia bacterium]